MIAGLVGYGSGAWVTGGLLVAVVGLSVLGCWFGGAAPEDRDRMVRAVRDEWRYRRDFRRWERQLRKANR